MAVCNYLGGITHLISDYRLFIPLALIDIGHQRSLFSDWTCDNDSGYLKGNVKKMMLAGLWRGLRTEERLDASTTPASVSTGFRMCLL